MCTSRKAIKKQLYCDYCLGEICDKLSAARSKRYSAMQEARRACPGKLLYPESSYYAERERIDGIYAEFKSHYHPSVEYMPKQALHTVYCSIIAHFRGKLHMNKITWTNLITIIRPHSFWSKDELLLHTLKRRFSGRVVLSWTMEDQAKLVETHVNHYRSRFV
jgi:hypothetical protein